MNQLTVPPKRQHVSFPPARLLHARALEASRTRRQIRKARPTMSGRFMVDPQTERRVPASFQDSDGRALGEPE